MKRYVGLLAISEDDPVISWHVGEQKQPTYDGFRVVDSRRISRECRDEVAACLFRASWASWRRAFAAQWDRDVRELTAYRSEMVQFSVFADVQIAGPATADVLGLDDERRAMLGMPPLHGDDAAG